LPPSDPDKKDYFSRKQCYTINTQAVVGANLKILGIATGFPGGIRDARALRQTSFYRKAQNSESLSQPIKRINDVNVRPLILGDSLYPLLSWIVKPYKEGPALTGVEKRFNQKVSSARVSVERAFGIYESKMALPIKKTRH